MNWFEDFGEQIAQDILLRDGTDDSKASAVVDAWGILDGDPDDNQTDINP